LPAAGAATREEEGEADEDEEKEESVSKKELIKTHPRMRSFTEWGGATTLGDAREEGAAEH
jgi:hypothetical protein